MPYIDALLLAVPDENKAAYTELATKSRTLFQQAGAITLREFWGVDVTEDEPVNFPAAVEREDGETVVLATIEWPDKATRDEGYEALGCHPILDQFRELFDGNRMCFGGFEELPL